MNIRTKKELKDFAGIMLMLSFALICPWLFIWLAGITGEDYFSVLARLAVGAIWICWLIIAIAFDNWRIALKAWLEFNANLLVIFGPLVIMVNQLSKGEMSFYGHPVQNLMYVSVLLFVLIMSWYALAKKRRTAEDISKI